MSEQSTMIDSLDPCNTEQKLLHLQIHCTYDVLERVVKSQVEKLATCFKVDLRVAPRENDSMTEH